MNNITQKEFLEQKLIELNIERIEKANKLINYANELRITMLDDGQMKANSEINFEEVMNTYAEFVYEKENFKKNFSSDNLKKLKIIQKCVDNINSQLYSYGESLINPCEFEEVIRKNIKYADIDLISSERKSFDPILYDMKKEFMFQCMSDLNAINTENVREENYAGFEEIVKQFVSMQETITNLLIFRADLEYENRIIDETKDKETPEEIIYFENYMAKLKRTLDFLIINTMKQNQLCLAAKVPSYTEFAKQTTLEDLKNEFTAISEVAIEHINSFKGTSFLPKDYTSSFLTSIEFINGFILEENSSFKRIRK